ncbi:hypothetical protein [Azospirillum largimobile]
MTGVGAPYPGRPRSPFLQPTLADFVLGDDPGGPDRSTPLR